MSIITFKDKNIKSFSERLLKCGFIITLLIYVLVQEVEAQNLVLQDTTITTNAIFSASSSITAGPNFTITSTGNVTFGTPNIYLRGEFVIESGGQFTVINDVVPGIETPDDAALPTEFALNQNYPNPFNPVTTIKYQISEISFVTLKVYDVLGNEIITLLSEEKSVGNYEFEFDATGLPSGIYFYRLQAGSFVETKKMVLLR